MLFWKVLAPDVQTRTTGTPLDNAVGTPEFIAQLISTQQRYVPSLNRNPDNDRFDVSLLIRPRNSDAAVTHLELTEDHTASEAYNAVRLLGFDGRQLWILTGNIAAYEHTTHRLIHLDELRRINPDLETLWPVGTYTVIDQLIVSTRDRQTIFAIDPLTLRAKPLAKLPPSPHPIPPHPVDSLITEAQSNDPSEIRPAWVLDAAYSSPMVFGSSQSQLRIHWKKIANQEIYRGWWCREFVWSPDCRLLGSSKIAIGRSLLHFWADIHTKMLLERGVIIGILLDGAERRPRGVAHSVSPSDHAGAAPA